MSTHIELVIKYKHGKIFFVIYFNILLCLLLILVIHFKYIYVIVINRYPNGVRKNVDKHNHIFIIFLCKLSSLKASMRNATSWKKINLSKLNMLT